MEAIMRFKVFVWLVNMAVMLAATESVRAQDKATLDLLLRKGIITQQDYDEVMKGAKEPVKEPPAREPLKDTTPVTSSTETGPGPHPIGSYKDLERAPGGIENLRKNSYRNVFTTLDNVLKHNERVSLGIVALKVQYIAGNTDQKPGISPGTADPPTGFAGNLPTRDENGFRIRAAEFYVTGRLTPWSTYYVEVDFARQSEVALNSMYMDFYTRDMVYANRLHPFIRQLRVGQFREPFGIEQGTSQGLLDFVNRAYYTDLSLGTVDSRAGDPGLNPFGKSNSTGFIQQLDVGAMLVGGIRQLPWEPEYEVSTFNGAGRNFNDNNADKDVSGRLIFTPTDGMKLYLASYYGSSFFNGSASGPLRNNTDVRKFRQGAMYTYIPPFFNNLVKLQGEYIEGYDNGFRRRTWYQYILFRPFPFLPNFEPAYRYEQFTVDTNRSNSLLDRHTVGFNYYFHTNMKLTVNYEFKHDENEGTPFVTSGGGTANPNNKNFFVTQIQFRY
jgi:hypothetical protein